MNKNIIIYFVIGLLILGLLIMTFFPGKIYAWRDSKRAGQDKCRSGIGYTEESWKEHMSHHPNIYAECLT